MFDESKLQMKNGVNAHVKIGDWMLVDCIGFLNIIPIVGSIAVLVIYLILAFGSKTAGPIKTRMQANFVWAAIILGIYIVLFIILAATGMLSEIITQIQNDPAFQGFGVALF